MVFYHKKKMVLDHAILRQNEILKVQIAKIKKENEDLKKENEKLKKALNRKDINFIKGL